MQTKNLVLIACVVLLTGCATSTLYVNYTQQRFAPKDQYYTESVYSQAQPLSTAATYYIIGRVSVEGFASSGVTPGTLTAQAQQIARTKGADAIINAATQVFRYYDGDTLLRFKGELVVFAPGK